jgi:hypothetical protein
MISVFYQHECARLNVIVSKARARLVRIKNLLARGVLLAGQYNHPTSSTWTVQSPDTLN